MARIYNHKPTVEPQSASEDISGTDNIEGPVEVTKYTEGEPLQEAEVISEGDPGTYIGEYIPAPNTQDDTVEERTDLPENYEAGTYSGGYESI